jgi:hypothetical protein
LKNKFNLIQFAFLVFFLCGCSSKSSSTFFHGEASESESPNGKYKLIVKNTDLNSEENWHHLYLLTQSTSEKKKLFSYARSAEVFWSPNDDVLAITNNIYSNRSNSYIYILNKDIIIDLEKEIKKIPSNKINFFRFHHLYVSGVEWINSTTFEFKVKGNGRGMPEEKIGDVDGIEANYYYVLNEGIRTKSVKLHKVN